MTSADSPTKTSVPNIILFGETGAGKSSIVNMLAGSEVAKSSSGASGCTFQSMRYRITIDGELYNVFDTAGLNEGDLGTVSAQDAIIELYALLKSLVTGVSLLVFCMRGPRIKDAAHKNWRMFHEVICRKKVPIVIAITGLEQEDVMDAWWTRNMSAFTRYQIFPEGVACITGTRGKRRKDGGYMFEEEYTESTGKMEELLKTHCLKEAWRVPQVKWFSSILNNSWAAKTFSFLKIAKTGPGMKQLVDRCGMTAEEARSLGEMLART